MAAKSRAHALLVLLTAFSGLVLTGVALVLVGRSLLFGEPLTELERRLPKGTPVLVAARELDELAAVLNGLSGGSLPGQLTELRTRFQELAGFDPLDREGWVKSGLEVDRPWVMASMGRSGLDDGALYLLVPVRDEEAALATLRRAFEESVSARIEEREADGRKVFVVEGDPRMQSAFTFDGGYLLAATVEPGADAPETALAALFDRKEADSLASRDEYQALKRNVESGWHLFGYAAPELVEDELPDQEELRRKALTRGLAGTLHVSEERLRGRLVSLQDKEGRAARIWMRGDDALGKRISGTALSAARASLDLKELYAAATRGNEEEAKQKEEELRTRYGVDLQKEVLENLAGHFSFAVLEPAGSSLLPIDGVLYAPVKDAELAIDTVKKLAQPFQGMGVKETGTGAERWFESNFGGVGVARGHLIAAAGASRLTAVRESLEKGGSFLEGVPSEQRSALTRGPPAYLWIDLARTSKLASGNTLAKRTAGDLLSAASALAGFWASIDTSKDAVLFDAELIAAPGGFGRLLEALPPDTKGKQAEAEPKDPAPDRETRSLPAEAEVMEVSLRDGVTTAVLVRNVGGTTWSAVRLLLDGRYTAEVEAVPAGGKVVLELEKFTDSEGASPNPDMVVRSLVIEAAQGRRELPLR